jgi:hypothetical protein
MKKLLLLDIIAGNETLSGHSFRFQSGCRAFTTNTSYETPLGRDSEKIEHRTSNIELRIWLAWGFIDFKTSESHIFEGWFRMAPFFFKLTTPSRRGHPHPVFKVDIRV